MGSLPGYGIARRIEQVSGNEILLNQGTIYASLVRPRQRGRISGDWGTSDNHRRAKFYSLTRSGRKQMAKGATIGLMRYPAKDGVICRYGHGS